MVSDANTVRPVAYGGTGVASLSALRSAMNVAPMQESPYDGSTGAGLVVGSFGLGTTPGNVTDFNGNPSSTAFLRTGATSVPNAPSTANVWVGLQVKKDSNSFFQLMADPSSGRVKTRMMTGGVWDTAWDEVRIVTEISDDGLGNVCWRYSDGYQECQWHGASMQCTTAQGTGYRSSNETWTYPLAFIGSHPDVQVTAKRTATATAPPFATLVNTSGETDDAVTTTRAVGTLMSFVDGAWGKIMWKATGYWR